MKDFFKDWGKRIFAVLGLLVLVVLVMDFNTRMASLTHLRAQLEYEEKRLEGLEKTRIAVKDDISYATSDAALEEHARQDNYFMEEDDIVIIPIPADVVTPELEEPVVEFVEPKSNWDAWLQWLFFTSP
jgi:cell division protein FtsB